LDCTANSFLPTFRPVITPRSVWAAPLGLNKVVTSLPLSVTFTLSSRTFFGTCTSTSASPSLIRSARLPSVRIAKLDLPPPPLSLPCSAVASCAAAPACMSLAVMSALPPPPQADMASAAHSAPHCPQKFQRRVCMVVSSRLGRH